MSLFSPRQAAVNGEIVVALLGDEATVKRFVKTEQGIQLKAENPIQTIEVPQDESENFRIVGRVLGVLRL